MYNYMQNWDFGPAQHWGMMGWGVGAWGGHEWLLPLLAVLAPIIILAVLWSIFWKGLALWHAARRGQYWWFIILLFVNTLGILEIIYLFVVAKLNIHKLFSTHSDHVQH